MEKFEVAFGGKNSDSKKLKKKKKKMETHQCLQPQLIWNSDSEVSDSEMKHLEDKQDEKIKNGTS